jgi:hypothetical protein
MPLPGFFQLQSSIFRAATKSCMMDFDNCNDLENDLDLCNWEYFTKTFDHDDILEEISVSTLQHDVGATLDECSTPITACVGDHATCSNAPLTVYVSNAPCRQPGSYPDKSNHLSMVAATESPVHSQVSAPRHCLSYDMQEMNCDHVVALHNMGACMYRTKCLASTDTSAMNESERTSATEVFLDSIQARRQEILNTTGSQRTSSLGSQSKSSLNSHEAPANSACSPAESHHDTPASRTYLHRTYGPSANVSTRDKTPSPLQSHPKLCKPLKVYNYFYRDERDNIVNGLQNHGDELPPPVTDFSQSKYEHLLHQRWYVRNYRYAFTSHTQV